MDTNKLMIPLSIVIAGVLIAGAVYYSGNKAPATTQKAATVTDAQAAVTIAPITAADHILGNPESKVILVEYSDTECPFCKTYHGTLQKLMADFGKDGKLAWVYRHFPIVQLHSKAPKEAEATECAAEQGGNDKFWAYTDKIYATTKSNNTLDPAQLPIIAKEIGLDVTKFNSCLASGKFADTVEAQRKDGSNAGGRGTPTSIIVSKTKINKDVLSYIDDVAVQFRLDTTKLRVSTDGKRIFLAGSMPYEVIKQLVTLLNNM